MSRGTRIALLAAAALLVVVAGTVLATRPPDVADEPSQLTQDGEDTPPTAEELAHAAERLRVSNVTVNDAELADLATRYGLGGAVRVIAWAAADAGDKWTVATITDLRDGSGMGWGKIAKDLGMHPGIGSIMGNGGGHGRDDAPGQQDGGTDEGDASGG